MKDINKTLYCSICGSTNVETKMWVNPNTHIVSDSCSDLSEEDDNWCNCCENHAELMTLQQLWEAFGEIPINNKDEIEKEFMNFPVGTSRFEVWNWFDERCPNNLHDDLMYPK